MAGPNSQRKILTVSWMIDAFTRWWNRPSKEQRILDAMSFTEWKSALEISDEADVGLSSFLVISQRLMEKGYAERKFIDRPYPKRNRSRYRKNEMYAINLGSDKWFIANKADASQYTGEPAGEVWAEEGTTAFLCRVGEEKRCVELSSQLDFFQGYAAAFKNMLGLCIKNLDYDETKLARVVLEREEALVVLRRLCMEFGDMEWDENLHLADIIDKHLGRHLDAGS